MNKVYYKDFLNNDLPDKSVNLIIADFPYFEVKGEFDFIWNSFDEFLAWVELCAKEFKRLLKDNGTLFVYGHAKKIAYKQVIFDRYFNLENSLVWENTNQHKQQIRFSKDLRSFAPVTERCLMYSNEIGMTGLQQIFSDEKCFIPIKEYLKSEKIKSKLSNKDFNYLFSNFTNKNGCLDRSVIEHYWQTSQWVLPTKEIYENVLQKTGFFTKPYEQLRQEYEQLRQEYEQLRQEYEQLRRPFNNFQNYGDVIRLPNYETKEYNHETIKPETLTRALILTCSRENDLILVPFAGSGTECAMAKKEKRIFIGFDINPEYVEMSNKRCDAIQNGLF